MSENTNRKQSLTNLSSSSSSSSSPPSLTLEKYSLSSFIFSSSLISSINMNIIYQQMCNYRTIYRTFQSLISNSIKLLNIVHKLIIIFIIKLISQHIFKLETTTTTTRTKLFIITLLTLTTIIEPIMCKKFLTNLRHRHHNKIYENRIIYQYGKQLEDQLPDCDRFAVCNKIDTYSQPWIEKQCQCTGNKVCSTTLNNDDGHTILHKSKQLKICENVTKLTTCKYFRDITWTITSHVDNRLSQKIHCTCPKNSVAYMIKHQAHNTPDGLEYKYYFACSPESKERCFRKEPCRLFTVQKRSNIEDVNTHTLCDCPNGYRCPSNHKETFVTENISKDNNSYPWIQARTYSAYCVKSDKNTYDLSSYKQQQQQQQQKQQEQKQQEKQKLLFKT